MDFTVVVCTSVHLSFLVDRGLNVCVYRSCGFFLLDIAFYFLPRATPNPHFTIIRLSIFEDVFLMLLVYLFFECHSSHWGVQGFCAFSVTS